MKPTPKQIYEIAAQLLDKENPQWKKVAEMMLEQANNDRPVPYLSSFESKKPERAPHFIPPKNPYKKGSGGYYSAFEHLSNCDDCELKYHTSRQYNKIRELLNIPLPPIDDHPPPKQSKKKWNAGNPLPVHSENPYKQGGGDYIAFNHIVACNGCESKYHTDQRYLSVRRNAMKAKKGK